MNVVKKIFALIVSLLVLSLFGCNADTPPVTTEPATSGGELTVKPSETSAATLPATDEPGASVTKPEPVRPAYYQESHMLCDIYDLLKLIGRTEVTDDGINCDFTASGIAFEAFVDGDLTFTVSCDRETYFTVFLNGERVEKRFKAEEGITEIVVEDIPDGFYEVRLLKQTEPQLSLSVLKKVEFYGSFVGPAEDKELYIEFIGDSITCGYGDLWTTSSEHPSGESGTALYSDGTQSYAFLAAEELDADYSIIGCSGIGLDKGYTAFNELDFYDKLSYFRSKNKEYDFDGRIPDVVVINLGTNDNSRGSTEEQMISNIKTLISTIREGYGEDVPIVWAYNMMGSCRFEWTQKALEQLGGEEAGLYSVKLNANNQGGNGHPSLSAQKMAAMTLADYIYALKLAK